MGIQEQFDELYDYQTGIRDAIDQVVQDWQGQVPLVGLLLVDHPQEEWQDRIFAATSAFTFATDRKPAGLTPQQSDAWDEHCLEIEFRGQQGMFREAQGLVAQNNVLGIAQDRAIENLTQVKDAVQTGDTLNTDWLANLIVGALFVIQAGGVEVFEGSNQVLAQQGLNFTRDNAGRILELLANRKLPADPREIGEYRAAKKRLQQFVEK